MSNWHNESDQPLSADAWLEAHHKAKLPERKAFAKRIAERSPRRIVDLGCGSGLWLQLLSDLLEKNCEFVGIDNDHRILEVARERARAWPQSSVFRSLDFEAKVHELPEADIYLAFNIFPYVSNPASLAEIIRSKLNPGGCLIVRQYDGALLRMGPMSDQDRQLIDGSLVESVSGSSQFKHYDLDRVFKMIACSKYDSKSIDFEVFRRVSPYPVEFQDYLRNTVEWTRKYIDDEARGRFDKWLNNQVYGEFRDVHSYFMEVDLVAWLS